MPEKFPVNDSQTLLSGTTPRYEDRAGSEVTENETARLWCSDWLVVQQYSTEEDVSIGHPMRLEVAFDRQNRCLENQITGMRVSKISDLPDVTLSRVSEECSLAKNWPI
jgi:hypothetical protein